MSIIVQSLSYQHPDRVDLFSSLCFSIPKSGKAALIGHNGTGKSTLLKILAGKLQPTGGNIFIKGNLYHVEQYVGQYEQCTIAEALGISKKLAALHAILEGDISINNFTALEDDWDIEERIKSAFSYWEVPYLSLTQPMQLLSGGEITKVILSGIQIYQPSVVLLDEPTNHLDAQGKELLYQYIRKSPNTFLIVSHDKKLLNSLDTILELTSDSIEIFNGNYDFYQAEKEKNLQILKSKVEEKEKTLKQMHKKNRETIERRQKQEIRGKTLSQKKNLPRIMMGNLKDQAEQNSAKQRGLMEHKVQHLSEELNKAKELIQKQMILKIDLRTPSVPQGKMLMEMHEVNFAFSHTLLWKTPINLQIRSGERIHITGRNGTGKTTLAQIITGERQTIYGTIKRNQFSTLYIDQNYSLINNSRTIFEQVQYFNERHLPEHELKMLLHYHQFPQETWDYPCNILSGGEKMKLMFCCIVISNQTPDMLLLDEPTNNMDIYAQEVLTQTIRNFKGTLVVISHDDTFIQEVEVNKSIRLI